MRRSLLVTAATAAITLLPATPALAHASFDVAALPAGTTQDLTVRIPVERDVANDLVEMLVDDRWGVEDCGTPEGWSCEIGRTEDDANHLVIYTRGEDGDGGVEQFGLTLTAPEQEGVYAFPTIQRYDDGVEAAWIGEPGGDAPAPRIQVGDSSSEVELAEAPDTHEDGVPDPDATPETIVTPVAEPSEEATPTEAAAPSDDATMDDTDPEGAEDDDAADDTGIPPVAIIGIALTAGLGLLVLARGRR